MKKNIRIKYLELDENRYIENDEFKIRINENNNTQDYISWEELWKRVRADIEKIRNYESQNSQLQQNN